MENKFMSQAIKQAHKALSCDEVPIGAVIVKNGVVIARGYNKTETLQNPTRHAEIIAIERACKKLNSWRLDDCQLYVTIEPCPMCAGAICNARIQRVYFGAYEPKSGCAVSKYPVLSDSGLNHNATFEGGIMLNECSTLLKNYFKSKRKKKNT